MAKQLWKLRWILLKKPGNISPEEKEAITAPERDDEGFIQRFRSIIRQLVNIFDHSHSEARAKIKLKQLRQEINALDPALASAGSLRLDAPAVTSHGPPVASRA